MDAKQKARPEAKAIFHLQQVSTMSMQFAKYNIAEIKDYAIIE